MQRPFALEAVALAVILAVAGTARADVPMPDATACDTRKLGDACTTSAGEPGVCATSTCSRLDYSHGTPPGTTEYPCTLCTAGRAGAAADAGATTGSGTAIPAPHNSRCSLEAAGAPSEGLLFLAVAVVLPLLRRRRGR